MSRFRSEASAENQVIITTDIAAVKLQTDVIDEASVKGLLGGHNSLAYRVHEIEKHFHSNEKWMGIAAVASGEIHVADRIAGGILPFNLLSGNDDFGNWVQIMGSADTPIKAGMVKFDMHRFIVTTTNSTNIFAIQVCIGESADLAALILAEDFTEFTYISASNNNDSGIEEAMNSRADAGSKVWARCLCINADAKTLSGYYGIHEYIG